MNKKDYGEFINHLPEIIPFIEISNDACRICIETMNRNLPMLTIENNNEFYTLLAQAKSQASAKNSYGWQTIGRKYF